MEYLKAPEWLRHTNLSLCEAGTQVPKVLLKKLHTDFYEGPLQQRAPRVKSAVTFSLSRQSAVSGLWSHLEDHPLLLHMGS